MSTESLPANAQPLQVAEGCWMIGARRSDSLLQCNTYLRQFVGPRQGVNICIDPGSQLDLAAIEANLNDLTGSQGVDYITINHQDPDVTGNLPALCASHPAATVVATEDTWRLVRHLRVRPGELHFPSPVQRRVEHWRDGVAWQPVPTPFCHFRGALASYDPESRILFTGDLLGGLNQLGRVHLFAEEADWEGIAQFHRIYMPTREVLRYAIRQIRALTPQVEIIAPQHGHVITGDLVPLFLERLHELLVGHDLLEEELEARLADDYRELMNQLLDAALMVLGEDELAARLADDFVDDGLDQHLAAVATGWEPRANGYAGTTKVFARLTQHEEESFVTDLRNRVLKFCSERHIPVPPIGWGV